MSGERCVFSNPWRIDGLHYELRDEFGLAYPVHVTSLVDAVDWFDHLARKEWVTRDHLAQFAELLLRDVSNDRGYLPRGGDA